MNEESMFVKTSEYKNQNKSDFIGSVATILQFATVLFSAYTYGSYPITGQLPDIKVISAITLAALITAIVCFYSKLNVFLKIVAAWFVFGNVIALLITMSPHP